MGHYIAKNTGKDPIPFRDSAGKHFIGAGESFALEGSQHAPKAEAAGLEVEWVQDSDAPQPVAQPEPPAATEEKQPKRKATVTARED